MAHPTMDRSSDCLLSASVLIRCSTRLISVTGKRRKTSSGSTPAQSTSSLMLLPASCNCPFLRDKYLRRRVSGDAKPAPEPEEMTDDSASVGRRSESVRVCRRWRWSNETSEENEAFRGKWLEPARGVERVDISDSSRSLVVPPVYSFVHSCSLL